MLGEVSKKEVLELYFWFVSATVPEKDLSSLKNIEGWGVIWMMVQ